MRAFLALIAAAAALAAPPALAQVQNLAGNRAQNDDGPAVVSDANAGTTPIAGDSVYKAFHEKAGIDRIVHRLTLLHHVDPRLKDIFAASDDVRLSTHLSEQICYITGGPCHYTGKDMTTAHKNMGLQIADFNALVEDLQASMDAEHVPTWAQNRLLAKLAPMERMAVTR